VERDRRGACLQADPARIAANRSALRWVAVHSQRVPQRVLAAALFKVNTAYKFDATNLIYATWSQGFRRGSVNALPTSELGGDYQLPDALKSLQPDKADNYEIGVKGTVQNRFRYSAAIFDIQWHNTQEGLQLTPLVLPAAMNIGNAYSRGIETEFEALLTQHLSAQVSYTYDQEQDYIAQSLVRVTQRCPRHPRRSAVHYPEHRSPALAVSLEYGHVELFGGEWRYAVSAHYQGATIPALSASALKVPGYTMVDTRLSFALSHWMTTLYVNNLTNNLGITSIQDPAIFGIAPRQSCRSRERWV